MRLAQSFFLLVLATLAACTTPTQQWATARIALNTSQDSLVALHQAGVLSDADFLKTEPVVLPLRKALDAMEKTLPDGGPVFDRLLATVKAGLAELRRIEEETHP